MIPAMGTSATLGEAISASLRMNSITLEPAWQSYLRGQAGLPPTELPAPAGELAMWCAPNTTDQVGSSIWRIRADRTGLARITAEGQNAGLPHWSPNGKQLAYTQGDSLSARVLVMDVDSQQVTLMADELKGVHLVGWLPDGRLEVAEQNWVHLMNVVSGEDHQFSDREQFWSPDGKWIVYTTARSPQPSIWIADSNGRGAHKIAPGYEPLWSPDGSLLAVTMAWRSGSGLWVIDVDAGLVRAQWQWSWTKAEASDRAWSSDGRHLAIGVKSDSLSQGEVSILDVQTGRHVELPGKGFDWSSDGKWLIITQEPTGILLVVSDLSAMRELETPSCIGVAWRPGR